MSYEDYNRGYQSGWSGVSKGPPRSAAEVVGHWNAQDDRRRFQMGGGPVSGYAGEGPGNGHLVIAGLVGGAVGMLYFKAVPGALPGALAGVLTMKALERLAVWSSRALGWIFRPVPVKRVAIGGALAAVAAPWLLGMGREPSLSASTATIGAAGALTSLAFAAVVRMSLAPIVYLFRRSTTSRH